MTSLVRLYTRTSWYKFYVNKTPGLLSRKLPEKIKTAKKGLLLFDYACHSCSETMLIFSVYLRFRTDLQPYLFSVHLHVMLHTSIFRRTYQKNDVMRGGR